MKMCLSRHYFMAIQCLMKMTVKKYLKLRSDILETQKDLLAVYYSLLYYLFAIVCNNIKESHYLLLTSFSFFFFIFSLADNEYSQGFSLVGAVLFLYFF